MHKCWVQVEGCDPTFVGTWGVRHLYGALTTTSRTILFAAHGQIAQLLHHQNLGCNPLRELPLQPVFRLSATQSGNQRFEREKEDAMAGLDCLDPKRYRQHGFAGAGRPEQD